MTRACNLCKKMFGNQKALQQHMKKRHGVKCREIRTFQVFNIGCDLPDETGVEDSRQEGT